MKSQEWICLAVFNKLMGVDMDGSQFDPPQDAEFNDAVVDTALDDGLKQQAVAEPEMQDAPPIVGMAAHNAWEAARELCPKHAR